MKSIEISGEMSGLTVREILKKSGVSRRLTTRLKAAPDGICIDGRRVKVSERAFEGSTIILNEPDSADIMANPELMGRVGVLYEDSEVIVFDKPADMPVHQSVKHREDTLANFFACLYPGRTFRPVNRLDRDTAGCVAAAKSSYAADFLQRELKKSYFGLIPPTPLSGGRISAPIARERESIILRCVREDGRYAVTNWVVRQRREDCCLCEFILETGRTHQIRVHMAHIGLPLIGDSMYGGDRSQRDSQALVCGELRFISPEHGREVRVRSGYLERL